MCKEPPTTVTGGDSTPPDEMQDFLCQLTFLGPTRAGIVYNLVQVEGEERVRGLGEPL